MERSIGEDRVALNIKEIKEIAEKFTPEQIEGCIHQQIRTGSNVCLDSRPTEEIVNELSKAEFVRKLMQRGVSLPEALRELAKQIRLMQAGFEGNGEEE
ncbi:MAG: hypothetical protein K8I29_11930 [Alphaproteobacteria bacterium]|uniref:Uncharacterized protein n=1 Tax=Candidatus Nitrobium versatile TaxID=2884831 RepID=A0A953M210_9BACT|nr:hypothetical protein [Candidatus Nitrobium versatile]